MSVGGCAPIDELETSFLMRRQEQAFFYPPGTSNQLPATTNIPSDRSDKGEGGNLDAGWHAFCS